MRIGYLGGTFDPPHRAHLLLAQSAADAFALERVVLAPAGNQPLKKTAPLASFEDRLAMVRLLCADDPRLKASDVDAPRADDTPNFTLDALAALQTVYPGAHLFALVGADSFLTLRAWREPERLLQCAEWIVAARPGVSLEDLASLHLTPEEQARVHLLADMEEDISATGIRERLRIGVSCGTALTPAVALYIARMHLYHAR